MRKLILGLVILLVSFILISCSNDKEEPSEGENDVQLTEEEKLPNDEVVALVNDNEINGETYNDQYLQLKTLALRLTDDIDIEQVKQDTLDTIIKNELMMQMARADNIEIDDETIEDEVANLKKYAEDEYKTLMMQFNYTDQSIANELKLELTRKIYIEKHIEVDVLEEEIEQLYEETKEKMQNIPEYELVRGQLKETVEVQKAIVEVDKHIEQFKKESDIEIKI